MYASPNLPVHPLAFHLGIHTSVLCIHVCISAVHADRFTCTIFLPVCVNRWYFLFLTYWCVLRVLAPESVWSACLMVVTRIYSLAYLCGAHTGDSTVIHRPEQVGLILKSLKILVWSLAFEAHLPESWTDHSLGVCGLCVCVLYNKIASGKT